MGSSTPFIFSDEKAILCLNFLTEKEAQKMAIGAANKPVYVNDNGAAVPFSDNIGSLTSGSSFAPVYVSGGAIVAPGNSETLGSNDDKPLKMSGGKLVPIATAIPRGTEVWNFQALDSTTTISKTVHVG